VTERDCWATGLVGRQRFPIQVGHYLLDHKGIFDTEMLLARTSRIEQRKNNFALLSSVLFRQHSFTNTQLLSLEEVMAIEAASDEVWIYAYDMKWEDGASDLPEIILQNLHNGANYRYIVLNRQKTLLRVQSLLKKYDNVPRRDSVVRFRIRSKNYENYKLRRHLTIYTNYE